jgi:putative iron-only hydrogenase system regulator
MENRAGILAIIVENPDSVESLNALLHEYSQYIIGRMGVPYRKMNISIISVAIDAPHDTISALSGKIGRLDGVNVKSVYSK